MSGTERNWGCYSIALVSRSSKGFTLSNALARSVVRSWSFWVDSLRGMASARSQTDCGCHRRPGCRTFHRVTRCQRTQAIDSLAGCARAFETDKSHPTIKPACAQHGDQCRDCACGFLRDRDRKVRTTVRSLETSAHRNVRWPKYQPASLGRTQSAQRWKTTKRGGIPRAEFLCDASAVRPGAAAISSALKADRMEMETSGH